MNKEEFSTVFSAASKMRSALEKTAKRLGIGFDRFPRGSCGPTCYLLSTYLAEQGSFDYLYICGYAGSQSHAWLEKDGTVVDITSDQFPDGVPVYVGKRKGIYDRFIVDQCSIHKMIDSHEKQDILTPNRMLWKYKIVRNCIEELKIEKD